MGVLTIQWGFQELDDVKHMNQMLLYSKCVTIRDAQIEEKKHIAQVCVGVLVCRMGVDSSPPASVVAPAWSDAQYCGVKA
jgi:hypothetical protein